MKTIHPIALFLLSTFALQAQPAAAPPVPPPATFAPAAVPVVAVPGPNGQKMIPKGMLRLEAAPLDQALNFFAELVGRTLIRPATLPNVSINFRAQTDLTHIEAVEALTTLFAANDIAILPVGEKFIKAVPAANAMKEGVAFTLLESMHLPEADTFTTKVVKLKNIRPSEIVQVLQPMAKLQSGITAIDASHTLVLRDYASNVKRMLELIEQVDVLMPIDDEVELIPIKYALSADIASVMGTLTSGGPTASATRAGGAAGGAAGGVGAFVPGGGNTAPTGGATGGGGTGGAPGQQNQPGGQQRSLQQRLQGATGRLAMTGSGVPILGETKIISYERSNSILVIAGKQEMIVAKKLLAQLDTVQQQVLIEAIIMDVSLSNEKEIGVSIGQQKQTLKNGSPSISSALGMKHGGSFYTGSNSITSLSNPGLNYWGFLGNNWEAAVNAVSIDGRVNILSRPRIQTSHAELGQFFVGETRPYITGTTTDITGSNRSTYQDKKIGITLEVLPFINPDGLVVMDINQIVQDMIGEVMIDGNPVPITAERSANAKIAVKDRESVMLGGFIRTKKTKTVSGVPLLKDIPLLGMLFSNSDETLDRKELIVLMRPTVLPTPEAAAAAAQIERDNLPGVKRAEANERSVESQEAKDFEKFLRDEEKKNKNKKP